LGTNALAGGVSIELGRERPQVTVSFTSKGIDLAELKDSEGAGENAEVPAQHARMTFERPFNFDGLDMVDLKMSLSAASLTAWGLTVEDLSTEAALSNGMVTLESLQMRIAGGELDLECRMDASTGESPSLSANLQGSDIDVGALLETLSGADELEGCPTEISLALKASGDSPAAMVDDLDGRLRVVVGAGQLNRKDLDRLIGDVFVNVLNTVNPLRSREATTRLECLVVNAPIREGILVIDHTAAFETRKAGVSVGGLIDLATGKMDLRVKPKAKEGLGLGMGVYPSLVRIQGTVWEPKIQVDPKGVAGAGVCLGIDVATFGMRALASGILSRISAGKVCEYALGEEMQTYEESQE
jgi:uncharacterized protein involved in outer membrane biogenesis